MYPKELCQIDLLKKRSDYVYHFQAACKSDEIDFLLMHKVYIKKEVVAMVIVIIDIAIGFILFFLFEYLGAMQSLSNFEVT
jgi:hypothetical protein